MWRATFVVLVCGVWACGEKRDELTPYVQELQKLQHYNETLASYETYLHTEGMANKANDIAAVMAAYQRDIAAIGAPDDKRLLALHNEMVRTFDQAMRKLVEPDFPTFVPNAQKALRLVRTEMISVFFNFNKLWEREGRTEPFPLQWPGSAAY